MRAEKQFLVDEVAAQLAASNYLLLANFTGVTVENATKVREQLRAHGAEYHVVKNSILNIAVKDAKLPELPREALTGHTALVTGGNNPTGVAKLLSKAEVESLSKLPSLDGIRAQLLSLLSTPASSFVRVLDAKRQAAEKAA